ncbi:hypothetical protein EIP91_011041 [Steccherinum ochraceum]|uniref:Uncharacterized protein n=1 Tax=Steccherinum ochraceum TaxID=92696 RepID=A0A4V2MUU4_9APHY|nr:hypothetical protein EIP91_011041 [Steccherinum ochraceum]
MCVCKGSRLAAVKGCSLGAACCAFYAVDNSCKNDYHKKRYEAKRNNTNVSSSTSGRKSKTTKTPRTTKSTAPSSAPTTASSSQPDAVSDSVAPESTDDRDLESEKSPAASADATTSDSNSNSSPAAASKTSTTKSKSRTLSQPTDKFYNDQVSLASFVSSRREEERRKQRTAPIETGFEMLEKAKGTILFRVWVTKGPPKLLRGLLNPAREFLPGTHPSLLKSGVVDDTGHCDVYDQALQSWVTCESSAAIEVPPDIKTLCIRSCGLQKSDCVDLPHFAIASLDRARASSLSLDIPTPSSSSSLTPDRSPSPSTDRSSPIPDVFGPTAASRARNSSGSHRRVSQTGAGRKYLKVLPFKTVWSFMVAVETDRAKTGNLELSLPPVTAAHGILCKKAGYNKAKNLLRCGDEGLWAKYKNKPFSEYCLAVQKISLPAPSPVLPFENQKERVYLSMDDGGTEDATDGLHVDSSVSTEASDNDIVMPIVDHDDGLSVTSDLDQLWLDNQDDIIPEFLNAALAITNVNSHPIPPSEPAVEQPNVYGVQWNYLDPNIISQDDGWMTGNGSYPWNVPPFALNPNIQLPDNLQQLFNSQD